MKKSIFKKIGIIGIITISLCFTQVSFAADSDGVKFSDSIRIEKRSDKSITIGNEITYTNSASNVPEVPSNVKDINFRYQLSDTFDCRAFGSIVGNDIKISLANANKSKIIYGIPFKLSIVLNGLDSNKTYRGCFQEDTPTPDVPGKTFSFWTDQVGSDGGITFSTITKTGFTATTKILYINKSREGKLLPGIPKLTYIVRDSNAKEISRSSVPIYTVPQYATPLVVSYDFKNIDIYKDYYVELIDESRNVFISENKFKAQIKPLVTTPQTTPAPAPTPTPTPAPAQTTSTNTIFVDEKSGDFTGGSNLYPGIRFDGTVTPKVVGNNLSITGVVKYSSISNTSSPEITRGGMLSLHLIDSQARTFSIKTVTALPVTGLIDYNAPYPFSVTYENFNKIPTESGAFIEKPNNLYPFSVMVSDEKLGLRSQNVPVVDKIEVTTQSTVSTNAAMSPQSNTSAPAANGSKATFTVTRADSDTSGRVMIEGTVDYSKPTDGSPTPTPTNIVAKLYSTKTTPNTLVKEQVVTVSGNKISTTFTDQDLTKAPFVINLEDKNLKVSSPSPFKVTAASASSSNSSVQQPKNQLNGNGTTTTEIKFSDIINAKDSSETSASVTSSVTFKNTGKGNTVIPSGSTVVLKAIDNVTGKTTFTSTNLVPSGSKYNTTIPLTAEATGLDKTKIYAMVFSATDGTIKNIVSGSRQFSFTANNPTDNGGKIKLKNPTKFNSIIELVNALVKNVIIPIAVPFLALAIMYTGFLFVTAKGNSDKITKAKEALKYTLLGGAIILGAYVIATALQGTVNDIIK
jgi:hypothetical protein